MTDRLHILITYALEDAHLDTIRAVDPRIEIELLGQDQRRLLRGRSTRASASGRPSPMGCTGVRARGRRVRLLGAELSAALSDGPDGQAAAGAN